MNYLEERLNMMKKYREEAMKNPIANRLYIEDLDLSIATFEAHVKTSKPLELKQGWSE